MAIKIIETKINNYNTTYKLDNDLQKKFDKAVIKYEKQLKYLQEN